MYKDALVQDLHHVVWNWSASQQLAFILVHALQQARREAISTAWDIYPRFQRKDGRSGTENTHSKVELTTELKPGTRPTQRKSMELLTVMAAEFLTKSSPHSYTTAAEVAGGV